MKLTYTLLIIFSLYGCYERIDSPPNCQGDAYFTLESISILEIDSSYIGKNMFIRFEHTFKSEIKFESEAFELTPSLINSPINMNADSILFESGRINWVLYETLPLNPTGFEKEIDYALFDKSSCQTGIPVIYSSKGQSIDTKMQFTSIYYE